MNKLITALAFVLPAATHALVCQDVTTSTPAVETLNRDVTEVVRPQFRPELCRAMRACYESIERTRYSWTPDDCGYPAKMMHWVRKDYDDNNKGSCNGTDEEIVINKFYSEEGYACINGGMRAAGLDAPLGIMAQTMADSLNRLPRYQGFVVRTVDLPPGVLSQYQVGATVRDAAFMSTSTGAGHGVGSTPYEQGQPSNGQELLIYSLSGRPIMGFGFNQGEREVILPPGTPLKVLSAVDRDNQRRFIMREVAANETPAQAAAADARVLAQARVPDNGPAWREGELWSCPAGKARVPTTITQQQRPANLARFFPAP